MRISKLFTLLATAIALGGSIPAALSQSANAPAADRYSQGELFEHRGDHQAALDAYTESAESGNGYAQKKLGEIYNTGNAVVVRDYETALKWNSKARAQGIEIATPDPIHLSNPGTRRQF